jgi:ABC-2 type transport system permease protein
VRRLTARLRRGIQIFRAFFDMGFSTAVNYPIDFGMSAVRPLVPVVTFFFVAKLVTDGPSVGGDYYSFVVIGFLVTDALTGALGGFTHEAQSAVQQGRFEMLLVEPIPWRILPFGLAGWPVVSRTGFAALAGVVAIGLGAEFQWSALPIAISLFFLAVGASLAIGVLSGAVGVLSKRSDPVLALYTLLAGILSGVAFPLELLPGPVRALSWLVPHTYVISGLRKVLLTEGSSVPGPTVVQALVGLTLFNLIVFPVVLWMFGRIMEAGRKSGVLSGY